MCVRKTSGTSTNHSYRHHPSSPPHSKRRPGAIEGFARAIPIMEEEKQPPPPPQQQQSKSSDAQTGLEESLWQMGLGGAEAGGSLPERPGEPDCVYFLRTGSCGFGDRCRFHHPRDRTVGTDLPERAGQPLCQYFMRTGTCKFGATCKYHHPNHGGSLHQVQLNYHGYPLRPGEKECAYYVKTGNCKFGATCKFHHPQPAGTMAAATAAFPGPTFYPPTVQTPSAPPSQPYSPAGSWPLARPSLYMPGSYAYGPMPVPPGVLSVPGWTPYQPHHVNPVVSSGAFQTVQAGAMYGGAPYQRSASTPAYTGLYPPAPSPSGHSSNSQKEHSFPERPGQPECQFYLRTGDCKYGASCRYHHPPEWSMPRTNCALSPLGLPIRPGAPPCTFYTQNGVCKFGPTCKFDHPVASLSYSPSASSLADIPVAPYPIGYSVAALAPSLSSSDLRHEYFGGISGDSFSVRAAHSGNRPSGLVGSMFSSGYPVSQSGRASAQQSTVQSDTRSSSSHGVVITSSS